MAPYLLFNEATFRGRSLVALFDYMQTNYN